MKYLKKNALLLIPVFITVILISSCEPDLPPAPPTLPPGSVWRHLDNDNLIAAAEGSGHSAPHPCPNPGMGCIVGVAPPQYYIAAHESLENFQTYYANNNVAGYFNNDPSWEYVFPSLHIDTVKLNKIKNGQYNTWMPVPNTVVFYDGSYPGAGASALGFVLEY